MFEVELLELAETELSDSFDWYEENVPSVGKKFYNEVNRYLQILERNPHQFASRYTEDLRVAPLNKFPFIIIYWVDEINRKVYVTSIFHTSRNPRNF